MAISVRDINEKQFALVKNGTGYNADEVDSFLDELAAQMDALIRENVAYKKAVEAAKAEKEALAYDKEVLINENKDLEKKLAESAKDPTYDEPSYFKNLEATMRESLISAQRIADEAVGTARKQAAEIVAAAEAKAAAITEESEAKVATASAEYESLKAAFADYNRSFNELVEAQAKLIKESTLLG